MNCIIYIMSIVPYHLIMCNIWSPVLVDLKSKVRNIDKLEKSMDRLLINMEKKELIINHPATLWRNYFKNGSKRLAYDMCWKVVNFWVYTDGKELYKKVDKTYHCDDRLCPICIERHMVSKRAKVMDLITKSDIVKDKYLYLMVLTISHSKRDHIYKSLDKTFKSKDIVKQLKNNARKWKNKSIFWVIDGAYWTFEITKWDNWWHPHINYLLISDKELDLVDLKNNKTWESLWTTTCEQIQKEWMEITWDSYVASVTKLTSWSDEELRKSVLEVIKYTMKDDCLDVRDKVEFLNAVKGKRLNWSWWSMYNVKLNTEDASDTSIDDIDINSDFEGNEGDSKDYKTKRQIGEMEKLADAVYKLWLFWYRPLYKRSKIIQIPWVKSKFILEDHIEEFYDRIDPGRYKKNLSE